MPPKDRPMSFGKTRPDTQNELVNEPEKKPWTVNLPLHLSPECDGSFLVNNMEECEGKGVFRQNFLNTLTDHVNDTTVYDCVGTPDLNWTKPQAV